MPQFFQHYLTLESNKALKSYVKLSPMTKINIVRFTSLYFYLCIKYIIPKFIIIRSGNFISMADDFAE